jgi:hypothetical protein
MLKRAKIGLMGAALPGFLAYTGWVEPLTSAARVIALVLVGFSAVSFLLSFFEDESVTAATTTTQDVNSPGVLVPVPIVNEQQAARVAP